MMVEAERLLREVGCPKISLQIRSTNIAVIEFYQHLGYAIGDRKYYPFLNYESWLDTSLLEIRQEFDLLSFIK